MFLAEALSAQEIAYIVMITSAFEAKRSINVALVLLNIKNTASPVHIMQTHTYLVFFRGTVMTQTVTEIFCLSFTKHFYHRPVTRGL